jgi:hypothetical protein
MRNRNSWDRNHEYIVNLARTLIGKITFDVIIRENKDRRVPGIMQSYVTGVITNKIQKMNESTLGRICAYASSHGAHAGKHSSATLRPKFINRTGLADVFGDGLTYVFTGMGVGEYLEQIAIAVITCTVFDIMCQEEWQTKWNLWKMTEEEEKAPQDLRK